MKTAIYIEDGVVQLVVTPESDFEKAAIETLGNGEVKAQMFFGQFYDCRGGWVRQSESIASQNSFGRTGDRSLILRVDRAVRDAIPESVAP